MSVLSRIRDRVVTADAVYGTILYAALIAVSASYEHAGDGIPNDSGGAGIHVRVEMFTGVSINMLEVLEWSATTLIVFWIAHVYARTIAGHGVRGGEDTRLGTSFRLALSHSSGMLWSAIPATLLLLLGVFGVLPDAADWALLVNVLVLGVLGYQSLSERRRPVIVRIIGGVVTALLGFLIILLDIAMH